MFALFFNSILNNFKELNFVLTTSTSLDLHKVLILSALLQVIIIITLSSFFRIKKVTAPSQNNCPIYTSLLHISNLEDAYSAKFLELILHESINLIYSTCVFLNPYNHEQEQFTFEIYDDADYQKIWQGIWQEKVATVRGKKALFFYNSNNLV